MALRVVFRKADNVMEIAGSQHHQPINLLPQHQRLRGFPHPAKVRHIMGCISMIKVLRHPFIETVLPVR